MGTFQRCTGRPFTPAADEGWRHSIATPIVTAAGAANHAGKDAVIKTGTAATISGKFTYGTISKDLQDEDVLVFLDDCSSWMSLGRHTTDSDGRFSFAGPAMPVGVYEVVFQVAGDQSLTRAYVWQLPAGTHLIVSDIDATLTTSDRAVFEQILNGSVIPDAYPSAEALIAAHAERGHVILYLTGRPYWLSEKSRAWLNARQFSPGALRVTDTNLDVAPTEGAVGEYKLARLNELLAQGFIIDAAYGNATTDIYAYLGAGVAPADVWIIGPNAGEQGTHAVAADWGPRAAEVSALPTVVQPFAWN